jgi:methyl-accepting chemotaxis protein
MSQFRLGALVFTFLAVTAFVWASESDGIREKARAMQREAAELAEQGHDDEAANLKRKAGAMLAEAERLQHHSPDRRKAEIMELKRLLEKLRQEEKQMREDPFDSGERLADVRREAERVEMELRKLTHQPHPEHAAPHDEIAGRLEHMRIAVEHLNQAGLHDVAEHVAQRAAAAERELHEHQSHRGQDVMHKIMSQLDELRHEVGQLRNAVNELKSKQQ